MLDATASWRAIVERHATPEAAQRLLESEFFTAATGHFPASQSYAAAEEMAAYLEAKVWDLVVVDTPPSAGGIEFFTAPAQMADLIGGRLLRWLTGAGLPGRQVFFDLAARPALRVADSVLGSNLLERVAQFLMDLRTTYDGVSRRAKEIERMLRRSSTVVVTTSDPGPMREAVRFFLELPDVAGRPAAVVFNRALPVDWADAHPGSDVTTALAENLERLGRGGAPAGRCPPRVRLALPGHTGDGALGANRTDRSRLARSAHRRSRWPSPDRPRGRVTRRLSAPPAGDGVIPGNLRE